MSVVLEPIGIIHSPFSEPVGAPIQPCFAEGVEGEAEIYEQFAQGLADLEGFSHLHLIYHFHRAAGYSLVVTPYLDDVPRGLFATRAPRRPNPLGLSVVRLLGVQRNRLALAELDVVDGTPLLDIKPFNPAIDHRSDCRVGWMTDRVQGSDRGRADARFAEEGGVRG